MSAVAYKVLGEDQQSCHGGQGRWVKRRWRAAYGPLVPCENGIHYCRRGQLVHWLGATIWLFEDGSPDETIDAGDKLVTRRGRIIERVEAWNETTARLFAADCAEAVLPISERQCPGDDRPRKAIEATRLYARGEIDSEALLAEYSAAYSAARAAANSAANSAYSATRAAANSAATSAYSAAYSAALLAANSAANSAYSAALLAAYSAALLAYSVARSAQTEILFDYLEGRRT